MQAAREGGCEFDYGHQLAEYEVFVGVEDAGRLVLEEDPNQVQGPPGVVLRRRRGGAEAADGRHDVRFHVGN